MNFHDIPFWVWILVGGAVATVGGLLGLHAAARDFEKKHGGKS